MSATGELAILADIAESINYASWQNSVPLLRSLELHNTTAEAVSDLRLEFDTVPACARPKTWIIERVAAGEKFFVRDRDLQLDPEYLIGLNEAERSVARFRLFKQDQLLAESGHGVRVLARDEWGGMSSMAELLPAFVMPNDPALAKILKLAGEVLANHGHSSALDGYQSRDPRRAYLLTAALWSAIASKSLTYANPPSSFEQVGQKIRRPATVLSDGLATCLDTTLLFAAAMEAIGLNPVIVMLDGHCFAGVWLVQKIARQPIEPDCGEIRKALDAEELITFETTLITQRPPARFEDAVHVAAAATRVSQEDRFIAAIDVARARMSQVRPLASHDSAPGKDDQTNFEGGPLPLPAAPNLRTTAADQTTEKPTTSSGRIERWRRKLLDLSLRNRLLNFKLNAQSVPVVCPDISQLEDRLAGRKKLKLISLSDENPIGQRDLELHHQKTKQDLNIEFARQALERNEVSCSLSKIDLSNRLTTLYRSVRNDLAEGGSNTLFLAVGFLKWKQKPEDTKSYRAPLLLVPVKLVRSSALSPYNLVHHEDDVRFNATLIQLLKKDFGRDISFFESDLPKDDSGVDVPQVLERMRREIRDIPGFEVIDESVLAKFSFAKYLMWKDLNDRIDQLEKNRVVKHLIHDPDKPFKPAASGSIPRPQEMDRRYEPQDLCHPLPADSSQLAAMMAASEGHDFVLIGPPGTGKSQTIANMITQCLANGKTVLFVAEKTAALDVVQRRLREHGLGDCCLELHSNRAERKKFLDQLQKSWQNNRRTAQSEWREVNARLKSLRDDLNAYVQGLHTEHANGWSVFQALGAVVKNGANESPKLTWSETVQHDAAAYKTKSQVIADLALTSGALDGSVTLPQVQVDEWSATWEARLLSTCDELQAAADALKKSLCAFAVSIGLPDCEDCSLSDLESFERVARVLPACKSEDLGLIFHKQFAKLPTAVEELRRSISSYRDAVAKASATYERESLDRIPVDDLDHQWRQACAAFWPLSWFAKRKIARLLQTYASSGVADPATDLPAIRSMQQQLAAVNSNPLAGQTRYWKGMETETEELHAVIKTAAELRQSIIQIGQPSNLTNQISRSIHTAVKKGATDQALDRLTSSFLGASQEFHEAVRKYTEIAGTGPFDTQTSGVVAGSTETATHVQSHRTHLQRWTAWCDVKKRAAVEELNSFLHAVESGQAQPSELGNLFSLSYARWWLPRGIDCNPSLRKFQRFRHEDAISEFRKLDDRARELSSAQAKAAIAHELPAPEEVPTNSELGLLRHQMNLQRPSKSIRDMISRMPESFGKLAPCLMMSPLSIAQYLPASHPPFDVVIFDEASQITTWDAIGAIARGRQTIIVGDPKQLPPTNFFGKADDDGDDDEIEDHEKDLESILDEASASGLPTLQLNWHYRSRHESLIAFSNEKYYRNLVTFPSAESENLGVSLRHLPEAVYDRGKTRTNLIEAQAIVNDAVQRMQECLKQTEKDRLTFGVVTFNIQQQTLIQDLLDQAVQDNPELEWYFSDDRIEPTMVKNLENVQGDERDVMYFSITFSPNAFGTVPLNFGALNRDGGERRLNVAVTRARQQLIVYSSFKGELLKAERSGKRGILDLKAFLEYAEKGYAALISGPGLSVGEHESPFEEAVAAALAAKGWQVTPQVGVSSFRVDLGVVHPDKPGAFLAGIECDGATYHRSATARDRDKTRQLILENLGWKIIRIWSSDWWYDSKSAMQRVHAALEELLQKSRQPPPPEGDAGELPSLDDAISPDEVKVNEASTSTHPVIASAVRNSVNDVEEFRLVPTPRRSSDSSKLGERILALLKRTPDLKARELVADKTEVNKALYGPLASKVVQIETRWRLI
jgi:very-short-patch-repair endonuclease